MFCKMILRGIWTFDLLLLICFKGVTSLRDVRLLVDPPVVIRGGTAALICERDMQGSPLYSVKWYRGNHEFYRYTPNELPNTRVFGLPGIYVDMNNSNGKQVMLRRLELGLAGNFSCEVTAEAPPFSTQIATRIINIVAPPTKDQILKANKDRYQPGEALRANCTSAPSRPAVNLTIYINDEPHRSSETALHPSEVGLYWSSVKVELNVTPELFVGGRLRLSCVAAIFNVYRSTATLDFFTPETDPRPERITFSGAPRNIPSWVFLMLLFLLPMLVMGQLYDEAEFKMDEIIEYGYEPDSTEHVYKALVGG
ncbi:hypothetical protein JYU34_004662 [Plutella xylostella]|uniref:Ig-like domain-containing protein n=1 Tax=Plutella xylostella TaxID=51655 RepID=A0ABQ7QYL8_PLUXY|nr:hypothetical protein JYU34_004662 [Plutella xylostella]